MTLYRLLSSAVLSAAIVTSAFAQSVTSARSGTIHTFDGTVLLDGKQVEKRPAYFPEMKEAAVLSTERGRAEVLLTPGVILRIGESSSVKMIDNRLLSTRVELLQGSAVLEQLSPESSPAKGSGTSATIIYQGYEVSLRKTGLVEFFTNPASMKVYKGEADVVTTGTLAALSRVVVKDGHMLTFNTVLAVEKFNDKVGDELLLWARDRSQAISAANMSAARNYGSSLLGSGSGYGGFGMGYGMGYGSGWYYNPFLGMYTFLPMYGTYYSPWGWGYYSPSSIYDVYSNSGYYWNGGGKATGPVGTVLGRNLPTATSTIAASINRLHNGGNGGTARPLAPSSGFVTADRAASYGNWAPFGNATASQNSLNSIASPSYTNNGNSSFSAPSSAMSHGSAASAAGSGGGSSAHGTARSK